MEEVMTKYSNSLLQYVIPLISQPPGKRPVTVGSGFLVKAYGKLFLVSARHVLERLHDPYGLYFYIRKCQLARVVGQALFTAQFGGESTDRLDVGIVELEEHEFPLDDELNKRPVLLNALAPGQVPRDLQQYLVVGYPSSQTKANPHTKVLKLKPSGFQIASMPNSAYVSLGLTQETHIVAALDVKRMNFPGGKISQIADPHGMSGAPIWLTYDGDNQAEQTPLIGILIEYHAKDRTLVATDVGVVVELINRACENITASQIV